MAALNALVQWSLGNRPVVLLFTLLFVLVGLDSARRLPVDAIPDVTTVQVAIITSAPALSPVEIEQYVTVPVERAMAGLPHSHEVRSISKYGLSVVTVVFSDDTDIYFARQLIMERMKAAEDAVPRQYGRPEMGPISSALGEIYQFSLTGEGHSLMELQELMDWYVAPQLRMVPGVVELNTFGGQTRQYQVMLDPARLHATGLSVKDVHNALEASNAIAGGGYLEHNKEHFVIGSEGLVRSLGDVRKVVVGTLPEGIPVLLENVGTVEFGAALRRGAASMDGKGEVVVGITLMLMGENARTVTEGVKQKLEMLRPTLPKGVLLEPFYDRSALVNRTIHTVLVNLGEGALLVMLVLFALLGGARAGVVAALTIPLAMLFALTMMRWRGMTGNLMSLGAIDFGLIVDGSVIIVENAVRRLGITRQELGRLLTPGERLEVVREATLEVRGATIFGEAVIAIVYVPILALSGMEGKMFRPMASTVLFAMLGAFVLSLTVVPVLCSYLLVPAEHEHETWLVRMLEKLHGPSLRWAVNHHRVTLSFAAAVLVLGGALFMQLGAEFLPQLDEGDLLIEARRLPGVALSESVETDLRIQRATMVVPEVLHVVSRSGSPALATDPMGMESSDNYIVLKPREQWRAGLTKEALAREIAARVAEEVPEVVAGMTQPIEMRSNELVAGVRSDVAAFIYGPDLKELSRLGDEVQRVVKSIPGAVDVRMEQVAGLRSLRIIPDRARLARHGLTVEDVNMVTETLAVGHGVGMVLEGERRFEITVKLRHGFQGDLATLRSLPLKAPNSGLVALGDVASLEFDEGPAQISREQQSRRLTVEFNVRGRDLMGVVEDARAAVLKSVPLPAGYRVEWGGQFQNFLEARERLSLVVPLALLLILFLLWMAFSAMAPAVMIFCNIPFAVVGGVAALWVRDMPFSISAGVGFIALSGVAVLNGLVLVTFARRQEEDGMLPAEAMTQAASLRLRPVAMTAAVAALGFLPMAFSNAPGSEVQRPLATVVMGGLVTATLLTLVVFPALYRAVYGRRKSSPPEPVAWE